MIRKSPLSRRALLRGAGGVAVGLPFLEAMLPGLASAQASVTKRFIVAFSGTVVGGVQHSVPSTMGPLPATLPTSWTALEPVKQHVTLISGMTIPVYNPGLGQAFIPGGSHSGTHGYNRGPILSGMGSYDSMQIAQACKTAQNPGNQTCDQYAADAFGTTRYRSLELKVQAVPYNGQASSSNGMMSARKQNGIVSALLPKVSPVGIYDLLFTGTMPPPTMNPNPTMPSQQLLRQKSVLDLVLADRTRLESKLSGEDKMRLEVHFEEIRNVEKSLSAQISGGGTMMTPPVMAGSPPARPGPDPTINSLNFGGWSNETWRGEVQADLIAYAIATDQVRVVSWMLTHDQCWLSSSNTTGTTVTYQNPTTTGLNDVHADSHDNNSGVRCAVNHNWHAKLWGRLVKNLADRRDANGSLLDNTFMSLVTAEGGNAHSRSNFTQAVAGLPAKIKAGQHISASGQHPARVQITGLQALGVPMNNTMGQVTGEIPGLLK